MDKKNYQKPNMKVVKLQHTAHLLSGSDKGATEGTDARQFNSSWDEE